MRGVAVEFFQLKMRGYSSAWCNSCIPCAGARSSRGRTRPFYISAARYPDGPANSFDAAGTGIPFYAILTARAFREKYPCPGSGSCSRNAALWLVGHARGNSSHEKAQKTQKFDREIRRIRERARSWLDKCKQLCNYYEAMHGLTQGEGSRIRFRMITAGEFRAPARCAGGAGRRGRYRRNGVSGYRRSNGLCGFGGFSCGLRNAIFGAKRQESAVSAVFAAFWRRRENRTGGRGEEAGNGVSVYRCIGHGWRSRNVQCFFNAIQGYSSLCNAFQR